MRAGRVIAGLAVFALLPLAHAEAAAGALDPAFDGDGKLVLAFDGFGLRDVASTSSDALVVAGTVVPATGPDRFGVARVLEDGQPDPGFAGGGVATATFTTLSVDATAAALDGDQVVVVGDGRDGDGPSRFALARFEADGDLDPTFGTAGVGRLWTTIDVDGTVADDHATDAVVQPDGKIVVVGSADADHRAVVLRYELDGDLDPTFSGNGLAIMSSGAARMRADAVALDAAGRVVLAGRAGGDLFLARFLTDGTPDATFGEGGQVRVDLGGSERAYGLAVDARGRLVLAGRRSTPDVGTMLVARVRPNGALDHNFDDDGWRKIRAGTTAADVFIQADGRLVVGGTDGSRFVLVRLLAAGSLDASFGGDGIVRTGFACCASKVAALTPGPGGSAVAGGGGPSALVARYLAA